MGIARKKSEVHVYMRKINIILPRDYDYNGIKPKISVSLKGEKVIATIIRSTFTSEGLHLVVNIPKEVDDKEFIKIFSQDGAIAYKRALVTVDENECIECGQCTAMCVYGALDLDENFSLIVNQDNCTGCRSCIDACVRRCITVQ
ncbi:4Fe-4S dicluster domain-containing protein [Candidatus Bathyarchaeota archaeon]|nr:4Fe-4S dicluster domain-containing protein [Candidatus Bathyarchaeota archaeon]